MASGTWDAWDRLLHQDDVDPLEVLRVGAQYQRYLAAVEREAIRAARANGKTWDEIAKALGRTRQAVWQRFRPEGRNVDPVVARRWLNDGTRPFGTFGPPTSP